MSLLDELFGQILQSEESIKQRFDQLKEAHSQILDYQSKMKDAEFEIQSLRGTMAVKNHKLVKEEVELKWLISKIEILKQQIANNHKKKEETLKETLQIEDLIIKERRDFIEETKQFAKCYELSVNFESEYDKRLAGQLKVARERKERLLKDLQSLETCKLKTVALKEKVEMVNRSITAMVLEKDDKEEEIRKMHQETILALKHKEEVSKEPQNSLEFKRLSEELSACQQKSAALNQRRKELLSELYVNQQEYMKKESYLKARQNNDGPQQMHQGSRNAAGSQSKGFWGNKQETQAQQGGRVRKK